MYFIFIFRNRAIFFAINNHTLLDASNKGDRENVYLNIIKNLNAHKSVMCFLMKYILTVKKFKLVKMYQFL